MLQEVWECCKIFRVIQSTLPAEWMHAYFFFKVQLYCKGRALFSTSDNEFPLHNAVFDNNLPLISRLINCRYDGVFFCEKNGLDSCGNTPLQLAVKLQYVDAVKVLCDLFTCPKLKPLNNCKQTNLTKHQNCPTNSINIYFSII